MSILLFISFFLSAVFLAFLIVPFIRRFASRYEIVDYPFAAKERKVHEKPTPLLGGVAIFFAFFLTFLFSLFLGVDYFSGGMKVKNLLGVFIGALLLMIGGLIDDKKNLKPSRQILWPILATLVTIIFGIGINYITNPFGGQIRLDGWEYILFWFQGTAYKFTVLADIFTFLWLLGMMYTTKFLDGLDGLVSGVTIIGSVVVFFLSLDPVVHQPETAMLAIILAGSFLGFLFWNWHPAKIFLGEGGSLFAGFMLGILSIISGSKVATTALIIGIPALDVLWIIVRRTFWERHSPFLADHKHLHFRLLSIGLSHRKVVLLLWFFVSYFGFAALFLQSQGKLIALVILSVSMFILGSGLVLAYYVRRKSGNHITRST